MKGLTIFTFSDVNRSQKLVLVIIGIIAVLFAGIVLITFWTTARSSEVYTRDVKEIESAFEAVQQGDFDVSLHMDSSQEFQTIGNDFNEMLEGLKAQIEENKELAEHAAFSQVKQLESQFNPHFLFNTLDNIRFMAKIDADAADKMILSLSGLLRYSIREVREEVTVKEDLEYLQNYLNILQIRFNKRFAYEMDVSPDIYDCVIPKLIIQPLLENAVKYGFDENKKLSVKLKGYQNKDQVVFICEDDGAGIEEELLQELQRQMTGDENTGTHLGLYNINRRIQLMYGQDYGVYLDSEKGRGTMVRLVLPKKRNESCTEC
jgi:sensor histidine kinase YesM